MSSQKLESLGQLTIKIS